MTMIPQTYVAAKKVVGVCRICRNNIWAEATDDGPFPKICGKATCLAAEVVKAKDKKAANKKK